MRADSTLNKKKLSSLKRINPLFKIVTVGDSEVGKTTFLNSVINKPISPNNLHKSVGNDYIIKKLNLTTDIEIRLEIWDTAGNQKLRTMVSSYYRGAHAVLMMFDNTNINTFYSIKNWLKEIKLFAPESCLKYLICNKIDYFASGDNTTTFSSFWTLNEEEVENFAKQNGLKYFKISCLNNLGIKELIKAVSYDIIDGFDEESLKMRSGSFKLGNSNGKNFTNQIISGENIDDKYSAANVISDKNTLYEQKNCCV